MDGGNVRHSDTGRGLDPSPLLLNTYIDLRIVNVIQLLDECVQSVHVLLVDGSLVGNIPDAERGYIRQNLDHGRSESNLVDKISQEDIGSLPVVQLHGDVQTLIL